MRGCQPLDDDELLRIKNWFDSRKDDYVLRNKTIFYTMLYIGCRISELLSIQVKDVFKFGKISNQIYLKRENTKGKRAGRICKLNSNVKDILKEYIDNTRFDSSNPYLFPSPLKKDKHLAVRTVQNQMEQMARECNIDKKFNCHSCRKTFAKHVFDKTKNDLVTTQVALGHASVSSTISYLSANNEKLNDVLNDMKF